MMASSFRTAASFVQRSGKLRGMRDFQVLGFHGKWNPVMKGNQGCLSSSPIVLPSKTQMPLGKSFSTLLGCWNSNPKSSVSFLKPTFPNPSLGKRNSMPGVISNSSASYCVETSPSARAAAKAAAGVPRDGDGIYPLERMPRKVLVLGSGGLSIGQAGEFDYSGSQAIKAMREEGIATVLVNPNIATVQTAPGLADKVYSLPVTPDFIEGVIRKEKPDGILLAFGGQTALNCGVALKNSGILEKYDVKVLGTPVQTIEDTEDRDLFARKLDEIGVSIARSVAVDTVEEAKEAAKKIGYPLMIRSAFALGGLGSGIVENEEELVELATKSLSSAPQILVEKSMKGWKEVEYEVVRDAYDNCITVCNMENFDPLGIHTGESVVVAPSQTLSNRDYHKLREIALKVIRHLGIIGECNIQYAYDTHSENYAVIEVNARLSRSSALASKATGYPLAFVAAKIGLGIPLPDIRNSVTQTTTACFEPALDYCVVKFPRWDLRKFKNVSPLIGSSMKSVGEVMAIGRSFEEALQKGLRMVDPAISGFNAGECASWSIEECEHELLNPTNLRVPAIARAFDLGWTVDDVAEKTQIDRWFLHKLYHIHELGEQARLAKELNQLSVDHLKKMKQSGFSDLQVAKLLSNCSEELVRSYRKKAGIIPVVKQIDTMAAEAPARTNYLYVTYNGTMDDVAFPKGNDHQKDGVAVLGSGVYRIGSSVEFDYCGVEAIRALRKQREKTIMINYNPETVSTDYDESDRLYFEELSTERVLDIYEKEHPRGIMVSVGGQIPNTLALPLQKAGAQILGTSPIDIDRAEDRHKFSSLLDKIGIDQPAWQELNSVDQVHSFCENVGYPVLVRPSYVLSGAAMKVVRRPADLELFLEEAGRVSKDHPVVVSKFMEGADELDFDGVADGSGALLTYAVSQHVEQAGTHSGDATLVLPPVDVDLDIQNQVVKIAQQVADGLNIRGPFNMQLLSENGNLKVIECNLRASRSFPFVSKTYGIPFVELATAVSTQDQQKIRHQFPPFPAASEDVSEPPARVSVKAPMFSFQRLLGADPTLGVEMASTGEVACSGLNKNEALLKAMLSANQKIPTDSVYLHAGTSFEGNTPFAKSRLEKLSTSLAWLSKKNIQVYASQETAKYLASKNLSVQVLDDASVIDKIKDRSLNLILNLEQDHLQDDYEKNYQMRRHAVDFGVPLITNPELGVAFLDALMSVPHFTIEATDEVLAPMRDPPTIPNPLYARS